MRDVASYRGPDDAGIYIDGNAGLGHRRLSIIDLGGGHQPMCDPSRRFWIPSGLAYGPNGGQGPIGPDATLTFDVELMGILQ
jgi:hypothetical protein